MTKKPRRTKLEREYDLDRIKEMRLQRMSLRQIAKKVGLSPQMVNKEVKELEKRYREQNDADIRAQKNEDLERLAYLERLAFQAWFKSCKVQVIKKEVDKDSGQWPGIDNHTTKKKLIGDPRYIKEIRELIVELHRLLGTYEAIKKDDENKGVGVGQVVLKQEVYIPGLPDGIDMDDLPPEIWHLLEGFLQNQQAHTYDIEAQKENE